VSIRLRLGLYYGLLAGLVVLVAATFVYALHTRAHYDDLDVMVQSSVQLVAGEYVAAEPSQRPNIFDATLVPGISLRVYDRDGRPGLATPNAAAAPPLDPREIVRQPSEPAYDPIAGLAPGTSERPGAEGTFRVLGDARGQRWRVYVGLIPSTGDYLVGEASLGQLDAMIDGLRRLTLLFAILAFGVTVIVGRALAGRALQPVAVLTEAAGAIARSQDFSQRVSVDHARDELGRLGATFNEMLASLEQAYHSQQRFIADASHELRAPLTAIQANLELLENQPNLSGADRDEAVAEASREAHRLGSLVRDLLTLARADAGVPLRREPVELDRVVLDVLREAHSLAHGQILELTDLAPSVVVGDPDRLKQLVLALVDNALKYTPPGGRIGLGLRRNGTTVSVTVADTGVGIAASDLPRVFERFYRADLARSRDPGGTGLGLPIARWIARQHGGDVVLASTPGQGTKAVVSLPLGV
jgi:two-component system OmpR family sensor kinase